MYQLPLTPTLIRPENCNESKSHDEPQGRTAAKYRFM